MRQKGFRFGCSIGDVYILLPFLRPEIYFTSYVKFYRDIILFYPGLDIKQFLILWEECEYKRGCLE
jgi:hypothetical protein